MKAQCLFLAVIACVLLSACHTQATSGFNSIVVDRTETSRQVAKRFLRARSMGNIEEMRAVVSPGAHLALQVAGVYSPGLRAFPNGTFWDRESMLEAEAEFRRELVGPLSIEILSLIAEDDRVAAEVLEYGIRASTQRAYTQHYSYHFLVKGGQISDIRLYQDTFLLWSTWSTVGVSPTPPYQIRTVDGSTALGREDVAAFRPGASGERINTNKDVVRRFLLAVPSGDIQSARDAWATDGVWCFAVGGRYSRYLRAFEGAPRWTVEEMLSMQQRALRDLREPMTLDIYPDSLVAEGDQVSVEAVAFLVRPNGRAYRQHYSIHFTLRNGKLVEGHVYQDTLHQYDVKLSHPGDVPIVASTSGLKG